MQTTIPALVIRRVYNAAPERVYQAWTDPELAAKFLCPGDVTIAGIALDARAGGAYRIDMRHEDGEVWTVRGVYREVVPGRRLSMTWKWDEEHAADERETLLTIDLAPHGTGTELTLTHELFASEESRNNHQRGWTMILDNMETL